MPSRYGSRQSDKACSAATYFWVGSETDWHGQHQQYRIAPFNGETPESIKVDQMLAWIDLPPINGPV